MKKYIVILVLTLLGYESIAQKEPIAPRKPNNGEYSIEEVKAFVQSDGTVAKWCRDNLIRMINKGYETLGNTKGLMIPISIGYSKMYRMNSRT